MSYSGIGQRLLVEFCFALASRVLFHSVVPQNNYLEYLEENIKHVLDSN